MLKRILQIAFVVFPLAMIMSCSDNESSLEDSPSIGDGSEQGGEANPGQDLQSMDRSALAQLIIETADSSTCSGDCNVIAFGAKPCGGPWGYLIYGDLENEDAFKEMVAVYHEKDNQYNIDNGLVSDCSIAPQPSEASIQCVEGKCVIVEE